MNVPKRGPIVELRVAITAAEYEQSLKFYCAGLGLAPEAEFSNEGGRATLLVLGQGTLEVFDEAQASAIDRIEVGRRVSGRIRLALEVPDLEQAVQRLLDHGATLVQGPVLTPWGDMNARFEDPDGTQVTLFQRA